MVRGRARRGADAGPVELHARDLPRTDPVQGRAADAERGPGLGCFRFQLVVLAIAHRPDAAERRLGLADWLSAALLFAVDRPAARRRPDDHLPAPPRRRRPARRGGGRSAARRRPSASSRTSARPRRPTGRPSRIRPRATKGPCDNSRPAPRTDPARVDTGGGAAHVPVLATFFSVRRGRDAFFKFYMKTLFARQVREYERQVRDPLPRLVQRGPRLGLRQRDPARSARLRDTGQAGGRRGHPRPRPSRRGVDLPAPPLDVPSGADGTRPRIPRLSDGEDGGERWTRAATTCSARSRPTPPSSGPTSSSRPTEQLRKFLDANKDRIAELGGLTLIDDDPDYLVDRPGPDLPQPDPLRRRADRRVDGETEVIETRRRARRALQPGRHLRGVRRGGSRGGRPGAGADRDADLLDVAGIGVDEAMPLGAGPVRRGRRRMGGDPARSRSTPRTTSSRPSASTTSRSSSRSGASAARPASSSSSRTPRRAC